MDKSVFISGASASIFDPDKMIKDLDRKLYLSQNQNISHIPFKWSEIDKIETNRDTPFRILVLLGGLWLPGRIKTVNSDNLFEMIQHNAINQVALVKKLKKSKFIDNNTNVLFISSLAATETDYSAPEYSYSKNLAEKLLEDICKVLNLKQLSIIRPPYISQSNMANLSNEFYGNLVPRDSVSKDEFMQMLNDKINEIFHDRS